ncbi:MAG: FG-GAP-like repeat-containing protein [Flavobacteriales bacterium]|nr:FG-GAP-like repeat-containing protein [Flavobacteriales bacterium]
MKKLITSYLLFILGIAINAQSVDITLTPDQNLDLFGAQSNMAVQLENEGAVNYSNMTLELELPTGVSYSFLTGNDAGRISMLNANNGIITFSVSGNLNTAESLNFIISYTADCNAMSAVQSGAVLRNKIAFLSNNQEVEAKTSSSYNLLYPALTIISVSPNQKTIQSGETFTRTIKIINGGNGRLNAFTLSDVHGTGLSWNSASIGSLSNNVLNLTGSDFNGIGNNDAFFDKNESIIITQTLEGFACQTTTISSDIEASWTDGNTTSCQVTSTTAHVTINLNTPKLSVSANDDIQSCFSINEGSLQELTLSNTGQGIAENVVLDVFNSSGNGFDPSVAVHLDHSDIEISIDNNSWNVISPQAIINGNAMACMSGNPTGKVTLSLPRIDPGNKIYLRWKTYRCCIDDCSPKKIMGWGYDVTYEDVCQTNSYQKDGIGQGVNSNTLNFFTESPTDIHDSEVEYFTYIISSLTNTIPEGQGAHYRLKFTLPQGLDWTGNPNDLTFTSGATLWSHEDLDYDPNTRILTANYFLTAPFTIPKSEVNVGLKGNCSVGASGVKWVDFDTYYIADTTCQQVCEIPMSCTESVDVYLHCPGSCTNGGIVFKSFDIKRTSLGLPDNNEDGLSDNSGGLDFSKIKLNRAMYGDTIQSTFSGVIENPNNIAWSKGYASSTFPLGVNLSAISCELKYYDASSQTYLNCNNIPVNYADNGSTRTFTYDFSLSNSCFAGVDYETGDSIILEPIYKVTGNIGGQVEEVTVNNEFYLSSVANPTNSADKYGCNTYRDRITLIGYFFGVSGNQNITISGCSKTITQDFHFSVGDCCSNYQGGNLFPFEYRSWAHLKEIETVVPMHYAIESAYIRQYRTKKTNQSATQTINPIQPYYSQSNYLKFDIESLYKENGGTFEFSDDGFSGTIYIKVAPSCDVPNNVFQSMPWTFIFNKHEHLGYGTETITTGQDNIRFKPRTLSINSQNPKIDGVEKVAKWNVALSTNGSSVDNAWVHITSPSSNINILRVVDLATGQELVKQNDIYIVGNVNSTNLQVQANYSNCSYDNIEFYAGYECSGLPNDFSSFKCSYSKVDLFIEPKPAELQAVLYGKTVGNDCSPIVEVEVEIASVQFSIVQDISLSLSTPGLDRISYQAGSAKLKYPLTGNYTSVSDPSVNNNEYTFDFNQINNRLKDRGLPGVLDLDSNRLKLKFNVILEDNFQSGDHIVNSISGYSSCGQALQNINLAFDPNIKFEEVSVAGLTGISENNWSVSWTDINNDGYEDVFLPNYSDGAPNKLMVNNGDGTFSQVQNALTNTNGGTVSGSWADYDNDGDLDVFLANNTSSVNQLYSNDGAGNFTLVNDGVITGHSGYSHAGAWGDFDNDGYLDLFVADFMPTKYNLLYKNNGDGTFTEIDNIISQEAQYSVTGHWTDMDADGDLDLLVCNTNGQANSVYRNLGNTNFEKLDNHPLALSGFNTTTSAWGDIDNDGDFDVVLCNASDQQNALFINQGNMDFSLVQNSIVSNDKGHSHTANFIDFDNDGDLDLVISNDQNQKSFFYANDGAGQFNKLDNDISRIEGDFFSNTWADYDRDGDLDLYMAEHSSGSNVFFANSKGQCLSWICMKLSGTQSNKQGLGAKVKVKAEINGGKRWITREIGTQIAGLGGQNSSRTYFGLGNATSIDSIIVQWPSGVVQSYDPAGLNTCYEIEEPVGTRLCGKIFHDENGNCVFDANENVVGQQSVQIGNSVVAANDTGLFSIYVTDGLYDVAFVEEGIWSKSCGILTINTENLNGTCDNDIAIVPSCVGVDLKLDIGVTAYRRGFRNLLTSLITNNGSQTAYNVEFILEVPAELSIVSSDSSFTVSDTTYSWFFDSLEIGKSILISMEDSVDLYADLSKTVTLSGSVESSGNECSLQDNQLAMSSEIVGAVDPNDKLVFPIGITAKGYITEVDTLHYKIRFQNVGNYPAWRVIVIDTLSENLDLNTLIIKNSSHKGRYTIDGSVVTWIFEGINLPDSVSNEPQSHGFVQFSIQPKKGLANESWVNNKAHIQFDFNDYIITNTTVNTIRNDIHLVGDRSLVIYPNPATHKVNVIGERKAFGATMNSDLVSVQVLDMNGIMVDEISINRELKTVVVSHLKTGSYILVAETKEGLLFKGKLVVSNSR